MITALKVALVVSVSGLLVFIADYTRLTKGACWKDAVGVTIIVKDVFLLGTLAPLLLAAFFRLSPLGNEVGAWSLVGFLFLAGVAMYWRVLVFERIARKGRGGPGGTAAAVTLPEGRREGGGR